MSSFRWADDNMQPIQVVSAEQHALDFPGHVVYVQSYIDVTHKCSVLRMTCASAHPQLEPDDNIWWDEQLVPEGDDAQA